jgi:cyclase
MTDTITNVHRKRVHRPRIMPVLLMHGDGLLYKTQKFTNPKYVGDPRNAVRIFNDKCADEIVLLDIKATIEGRKPNYKLIEEIASEAFMPMAYGGGIADLQDAKMLFSVGIEKIILNSSIVNNLPLVKQIADYCGTSSVLASIDIKKDLLGRAHVYTHGGQKKQVIDPVTYAKELERWGAGEIMINSINRDGLFSGYDHDICSKIASSVSIPVIACGGAGKIEDCAKVIKETGCSAAAAGSIFIFQGPHRAVLIKFPTDEQLKALF